MSNSNTPDPSHPRLHAWARRMRHTHGPNLHIVLTNNRRSMLSIRARPDGHKSLRIHRAFEHAPDSILSDLSALLAGKRGPPWSRVRAFARDIPTHHPPHPHAPIPEHPAGQHHHLRDILDDVNHHFFQGQLDATITWSQAPTSTPRRRRSIQFGVWDPARNQVRIHPLLDDPRVPRTFIHYLVYHELCHKIHPPYTDPSGRRRVHHPQFKALEARYPNRPRMDTLSKQIFTLLTSP